MKGDPDICAKLQEILGNELAAIDQYLIHSRMYEDWGYQTLYRRMEHESLEERHHADQLIRRMLFLEHQPDLSQRDGVNVGTDVPGMMRNDLAVEYKVRDLLRETIALCEARHDYQTRQILLPLLHDTEQDHIYWLEQQLRLIEAMGLANYLQSQAGSPPVGD